MKHKKKIILFTFVFVLSYYVFSYIYFFINGDYVYVLEKNIDSATYITGDFVKKVRINYKLDNSISENPVGKYSTHEIKSGKILYNNDVTENIIQVENCKVVLYVNNVDNLAKKYILDKEYVDIYYIQDKKVINVYQNVRVINIEILNETKSRFLIEVNNDLVKEIQLIKENGKFEVSF